MIVETGIGLIHAIIIFIVGVVLYAVGKSGKLPPVADTICYYLGIALAVIGIILIVLDIV